MLGTKHPLPDGQQLGQLLHRTGRIPRLPPPPGGQSVPGGEGVGMLGTAEARGCLDKGGAQPDGLAVVACARLRLRLRPAGGAGCPR
jgi:hypothetical protein